MEELPGAPSRRRIQRPLVIAASAAATIIAAAAIIVPWAVGADDPRTSADTVEVRGDAESLQGVDQADALLGAFVVGDPYEEHSGTWRWRLPVSAPLATLPEEPDFADSRCSDAQLEWLREHALPVDGRWNFQTIRNSAVHGGAISIENIRFLGVSEEAGEPWVHFSCPSRGIGDGQPPPVWVPVDGSPAIWGESPDAGWETYPAGAPVIITLQPGETFTNNFVETGVLDADLRGPIVGDLGDGSGSVVIIEEVRVDRQPIPGFRIGWDRWAAGGVTDLQCATPDPSGAVEFGRLVMIEQSCTLGEAEALLRQAASSTRENPTGLWWGGH